MNRIWIIVLIVIGVVAAVFAFEYLTVGIGHLPSWVPGHMAHKHGKEHKRGTVAAVIALVAFAGAAWFIYREFLASRTAKAAETV